MNWRSSISTTATTTGRRCTAMSAEPAGLPYLRDRRRTHGAGSCRCRIEGREAPKLLMTSHDKNCTNATLPVLFGTIDFRAIHRS